MTSSDAEVECIRVALRVRPLLGREVTEGCDTVVQYPAPSQVMIGKRAFTFDDVYPEGAKQLDVYTHTVAPLLKNFLSAYNATIFAYGQTGSGKTYTMGTSGAAADDTTAGIVPRIVYDLFRAFDENSETHNYAVYVSFMEIHKDDMIDLLAPKKEARTPPVIREIDGQIVIQNLEKVSLSSPEEMLGCLERGSLERATGATLMNETSSRSHAIFTIYLDQVKLAVEDENGNECVEEQLSSKFHFVDLAGSERLKRTGAVGNRMKEGISINSGLLALGNVISALGDPKRKGSHVPFRDSKITRLLQDSLGGNSKTAMLACVSPADVNFEETLNTLKYANRARNIQNKAIINRDPNSAKIAKMQARINELEAALAASGGEIPVAGAGNIGASGQGASGAAGGKHGPTMSPSFQSLFNPSAEELTFLREQNADLDRELKRVTGDLKQVRKQMSEVTDTLMGIEQQRDTYRLKLEKAAKVLSGMDNPPDLGLDAALSDEENNLLQSNLKTIHELKEELSVKKVELSATQAQVETLKDQITTGLRMRVAHSPGDPFATPPILKHMSRTGSITDMTPGGRHHPMGSLSMSAKDAILSIEGVGDVFSTLVGHNPDAARGELENEDENGELLLNGDEQDEEDGEGESNEVKALETLAAVKAREHDMNMRMMTSAHSELDRNIQQKETLIQELMKTREKARAMAMQYESKIQEMQSEIQQVMAQQESEVGKLDKSNKNYATEEKKTIQKYQKKLTTMNKQLKKFEEKASEATRLKVAYEKDEARIKRLQMEIESHRNEKVRLARKMKEDQTKHREFVKEKAHKVKQLEKQQRQSKAEMRRMRSQIDKQAAVLKRRTEEKAALQQRLQRQIDMRKSNTASKASNVSSALAKKKRIQQRARARRRLSVSGVQSVASFDVISRLLDGFDDEIEMRVVQMGNNARLAKMLGKRAEAASSLAQAEQVLEKPDPGLSEEVLEYWRDRVEALKAQISHFNMQIVELRVSNAKLEQENSQRQKSIFSRHPITQLDQSRSVILYLIDDVVNLRHQSEDKDARLEELHEQLVQVKSDLKAVTRQSLRLQNTPSARKLLQEMQEMDHAMERLAMEGEDADERYNAAADGLEMDGSVRNFFKALKISSPQVAGKRRSVPRQDVEAAFYERDEDDGDEDEDADADADADEDRDDDYAPGGRGKRGGGRKYDNLKPQRMFVRSARSHPGSGDVSPRSPGSSNRSPYDDEDEDDDDADDSSVGGSGKKRRKARKNVWDRLTDTSTFTGVYKKIHEDRPVVRSRDKLRDPGSGANVLLPVGSPASVASTDQSDTDAPPGLPRVGTHPVSYKESRASRKARGDVFDRLTDKESFTGIFRAKKSSDGGKGRDRRGRNVSSGGGKESVFDRLTDESSYTGIHRNKSGDTSGTPPTLANTRQARSLSQMERELESMSEEWQEDKTRASDGVQFDKSSAKAAVNSIGSILDQRQRIARQLGGDDDPASPTSTQSSSSSMAGMGSPAPNPKEVLKAFEMVFDGAGKSKE